MAGLWAVFGWTILRAACFIAVVSAAVYRLTGDPRLVKAYWTAHLLAIALGAGVDVLLIKYYMPRGGLPVAYVNAIFLAPIVFFIGFSLYLCHRETALHLGDVLLAIAPVVAWGCLVVWGWQGMKLAAYDVLGAWFVSAACGGVDLIVSFGPETVRKNPWAAKVTGYIACLLAVYVALPLTGSR